MGTTVYLLCSFQTPNVLLSYTLSDPMRVVPMGTLHICLCGEIIPKTQGITFPLDPLKLGHVSRRR